MIKKNLILLFLCLFFVSFLPLLFTPSPEFSLKAKTTSPEYTACSSIPFLHLQTSPSWWEIKILLDSSGNYKIKQGKKSYVGQYSFNLIWTGCMEQDMEDYIIYHETSKLLKWNAQEKAKPPDSSPMLSEKDFSGKPHFDFHYMLRKGKDLHFNFQVESFYIPQNSANHKFYLYLPASKENTNYPSKFNYNSYVSQGSNSIYIKEEKMYLETIEKKYRWEWKFQKWLSHQKMPISFSNWHKVEVTLSIRPHY